jgi:hypothetical protein
MMTLFLGLLITLLRISIQAMQLSERMYGTVTILFPEMVTIVLHMTMDIMEVQQVI